MMFQNALTNKNALATPDRHFRQPHEPCGGEYSERPEGLVSP
jgi:hypothetical protein